MEAVCWSNCWFENAIICRYCIQSLIPGRYQDFTCLHQAPIPFCEGKLYSHKYVMYVNLMSAFVCRQWVIHFVIYERDMHACTHTHTHTHTHAHTHTHTCTIVHAHTHTHCSFVLTELFRVGVKLRILLYQPPGLKLTSNGFYFLASCEPHKVTSGQTRVKMYDFIMWHVQVNSSAHMTIVM